MLCMEDLRRHLRQGILSYLSTNEATSIRTNKVLLKLNEICSLKATRRKPTETLSSSVGELGVIKRNH